MREILFRGKRIDNGEWVEGFYVERNGTSWIYPAGDPIISRSLARELRPGHSAKSTQKIMREVFPVARETVGQYTGLNANGKKIFEGDIVRIERAEWGFDGMSTDYRTEQGVIAYDDLGMVGLIVGKYENRPVWSDFFHVCGLTDRVHDWSFEIIGNCHDNPELLKGAENDG